LRVACALSREVCIAELCAAELEEADDGKDEEGEEGADGRGKQNRNEKKARKALQKLGLKPIPGVAKVTVKKSKQVGACSCPLAVAGG
jgi:hypothetical protein